MRAAPDQRATTTIVLAEDESVLRELEETILTQAGYKVLTAPTIPQLQSLLAEFADSLDLLVTDVVMPELSGPELARWVRKASPNIRVLYVSGHAGDEIAGLEPGAAFLQKPFTPAELMAKVNDTLGTKLPTPDAVTGSLRNSG